MAIRNADMQPLRVVAIALDGTPQLVHNLEVAGAHTYFAGELEAWGHNAGIGHNGGPSRANPFRGLTACEIAALFDAKGYSRRGPDPVNGLGGWVSSSGRSFHIDPGGSYAKGCEASHVDANYRRGRGPGGKPKKKFWR